MTQYKVLLVDDDIALLKLLTRYLTDNGFDVITATRGQDALRLLYDSRPEIVLMDIMIPGMDGWVLAARIREFSSIPLMFITAKTSEADKLRGFRIGVDDYITKPFSFAELTARMQAVLTRTYQRTSPESAANALAIHDLNIDLDRQLVTRAGDEVPLSPTEFKLLRFMVENRDRAISEEELLQEVWGLGPDSENNYVRRYIWFLRQKLEPDPATPTLIQTVRGYGYRFMV